MTHLPAFVFSALFALIFFGLLGCAPGRYGPSLDTPAADSPRGIDEISGRQRRQLLDRAHVWRPIETARLDLLSGPAANDGFAFDAAVPCTFDFPDEPLTGVTPKFECDLGDGDVVKVKYGKDNGEVYGEVAATRLFWALGFFVDRMYPVKVTCLLCPTEDPFDVSTAQWRLGRPGNVRTQVFDPAVIERPFEGEKIAVEGYEGWSWLELEAVADNAVGAPRAHIDALKLLAAFVQHVDSKPRQQALVCPERALGEDRSGNETCARPLLVVKDLGSTFAASHPLTALPFAKMKLESWRGEPVWRDAASCQANLSASIKGTLRHPRISEAGRQFLADRLMLLSDAQLRDLFTASRVDRRNHELDGRPVTVDDWVAEFKRKRAQIVEHRCSQ